MAQWLMNPTRNHEVADSVPSLAQWVKGSSIAVSCGVGCRYRLDPVLLRLWCRPETAAPFQPPPRLGISICHRHSPKKIKKEKQRKLGAEAKV